MLRVFLVILFMSFMASESQSQDHYQKLDYYMYLFAKNIEWTDSLENDAFYIGVLGESLATPHLEYLAENEKIREMDIKILTFPDLEHIKFCHLLFIPEEWAHTAKRALDHTSISTLVITESPGEAVSGSGINIHWTKKGKEMTYEVNKAAFRKAGLKISAQLISSSAH